MNLGPVLRRKRKAMKLTMKEVAEKAGISEGFLSQIENNVNSPSVDTLVNICGAMGINAGDVLNQVEKEEKFIVIKNGEWDDVDIPHSGFATKRFFPPEYRSVIDTSILVIEPKKLIPVRKNIKNSQELLHVIKGKVELTHGKEKIILSTGDSIHYWTNIENQQIVNISKVRSIVLWAGTL